MGAFLLAFLPGWVWARVLMRSISTRIERLVASVVLSIALVVLALYLGNVVAGVPVSGRSAIGWSLVLSLAGAGLLASPWLHKHLVVVK